MVAEVVHGAPCRFADPARFSSPTAARTAIPFRCRSRVYDQTIDVLERAVGGRRLGQSERLEAIRRLR